MNKHNNFCKKTKKYPKIYRQLLRFNLALLICFSCALGAQDTQTSKLPLKLQAEHGEYDHKSGIATYRGAVQIEQGEMYLKADKVVVHLQSEKVNSIEAWGELASFHYTPSNKMPIDGKGQYMKYDVKSATVVIEGQAHVKQGKNETTGKKLTYLLDEEIVRGSDVDMIFQPQQK